MGKIRVYLNFLKFEHSIFSLPVVFSGTLLAVEHFLPLYKSLLVVIATISARSFGMTANRIIDLNIDRENPRTKNRELPAGKVSLPEAYTILAISALCFILTAGLLNRLCLLLSPLPLILFYLYPYLKRFTCLSHFGLGFAWSFGPLGGWLAVRGNFADFTLPFFLIVFCFFWLSGMDILYALQDMAFDREAGIKSIPACLGVKRSLLSVFFFYLLGLSFLWLLLFFYLEVNLYSLFFLLLVSLILFFEIFFWRYTEIAFFKLNALVSILILLFIYSGVK